MANEMVYCKVIRTLVRTERSHGCDRILVCEDKHGNKLVNFGNDSHNENVMLLYHFEKAIKKLAINLIKDGKL